MRDNPYLMIIALLPFWLLIAMPSLYIYVSVLMAVLVAVYWECRRRGIARGLVLRFVVAYCSNSLMGLIGYGLRGEGLDIRSLNDDLSGVLLVLLVIINCAAVFMPTREMKK